MSNKPFRLRSLFANQTDKWLLAWFLAVVVALSVIGLLMLSGWFISAAAVAGMLALGSHSFNYMVPAAVIRMFAMLRTAGRYGEMMLSHHAVLGLLQQLRVDFFNKFARLPTAHLSNQLSDVHSGHVMHRLTHDIDILNEFPLRVVSPWLVAWLSVALLSALSFVWLGNGMVAGILLIAFLGLPAVLAYLGKSTAKALQDLAETRRVGLLNPLSAVTHLLIWQSLQTQLQHFYHLETQHTKLQQNIQHRQSLTLLVMNWLMAGAVMLVLWQFYQTPTLLSVPILLALILGIFALLDLLSPLVAHHLALGNSINARDKLNALTKPSVSHAPSPVPVKLTTDAPLTLNVHQLCAKLPSAIVGITGLTFSATQSRPLLITGRSGAGKSTLLQVLAYELPPQKGVITLNGIDWQNLRDTTDFIGYLGQEIDIFDQTLASNLRLGKPDAGDDELWQVLDLVGLKTWAGEQPEKLDTPLGEYGRGLSGGQARRVALARLLLSPKMVLLLDEPFAGLDQDSIQRLWHNLRQHHQGLLIIATHYMGFDKAVDVVNLPEPDLVN